MSSLDQQLQQILSDPEQMAEIQRLASSLLGGETEAPPSPSFDPGKLGALLGAAQGEDDKTALLRAMRPWLSPGRQAKLDRALQMTRMARAARLVMAQMGENGDV